VKTEVEPTKSAPVTKERITDAQAPELVAAPAPEVVEAAAPAAETVPEA
jgi:hypothetical protein